MIKLQDKAAENTGYICEGASQNILEPTKDVPTTFGSPWEAKMVLRRSNGYEPTVAAHPANAPLI